MFLVSAYHGFVDAEGSRHLITRKRVFIRHEVNAGSSSSAYVRYCPLLSPFCLPPVHISFLSDIKSSFDYLSGRFQLESTILHN